MSSRLVYKGDPDRGREWRDILARDAPDIEFRLWPDIGDPNTVDYAMVWEPPSDLFSTLPRLKVLISIGAGIDHLDLAGVPPEVPLVRMVEPGITRTMVDYVSLAVLALHRNLLDYISQQERKVWREIRVRPGSDARVGVMGLGVLGSAVLERLGALGFQRAGWSRTPKRMPHVDCHAGRHGFPPFLAELDILVCLLPLTDETRGILSEETFAMLPHGAALVNVGRGGHLVEADLIAALESGRLTGAVLDVFNPEPPPSDHPFWTHPRILMTPHIASMTQPRTASPLLIENIRRFERGEPLFNVVDRARGY